MPVNAKQFHTDQFLTGTALANGAYTLIADQIFPIRSVAQQSGILPSIDPNRQLLRLIDTEVSPGARYPSIEVQVSKDLSFFCKKWGVNQPIPDEFRANAVNETELSINGALNVGKLLTLKREKALVDGLVAAYTGGAYTLTPSTKWGAAAGTPLAQIKTAIALIESRSGVSPNILGLDVQVLRAIFNTTEVTEKQIYTLSPIQQGNSTDVMATMLAGMLGIDRVLVTKNAFINTAAKDAVAVLTPCWGQLAFLCRVEAPSLEFNGTGLHTAWNGNGKAGGGEQDGVRVRQYRAEDQDADIVAGSMFVDRLICNKDTGFLFAGTLS